MSDREQYEYLTRHVRVGDNERCSTRIGSAEERIYRNRLESEGWTLVYQDVTIAEFFSVYRREIPA